MAELYESDILAWSEQQSDLLRRLARGERVDGRPPLPEPLFCDVTLDEMLVETD
jgi:hypothetical protein